MAALDSNVYKTPSFTALGLKKDKQVKDERDFRGREASATGAERAFGDAQYEVTGARKDVLQEAYNLYSGAATKYEKSGSDVDGKTMKDLASKVNFFAGAGMSMQGEWNKTYADAQANEFVGYSENPEQIQQRYNQRMYDNAEVKTENGKILIKEGDKFVPAEQSSFFSSQINPNNSFLLPKAIQTGKYAIPSAYAEEIKGVITSSQNAEQAIDKATSEFQHRLKSDASFRQDVGLHYYINDLNLIDGKQGVSRGDMRKVDERMLDEEFFGKAVESYLGNIQSSIKNSMSTSAIKSNPSYIETIKDTDTEVEMFAIEKVGDIVGVGVAEDGKFYISKQITSGVPPQMVEATGAEIAQIERKLGVSVKGMNKQTESETPQQTQQPQQIQESEPEVEEVKQMLPKQEEVKGTEGDGLGLGFTPETGRAAPADAESNVASVKISPNIDFNTDSVEKVMAHWTTDQGRKKSEITPQMIIGVSNKYNIPVEVTMAMLATEGNFGTSERQVKTKNPFNWGNTTSGDDKSGKEQDKFNKYYDTWEEGIDAWGEGFSRLYRPESGNWSELWEKEFVRKDGKRYATDKNYEKTIASIVNNTIPKYAA
tara:strand:- start:1689 stop:3482 length:1794 start_codon:yes stop_codon:yes gene_type:complete